MDEAIAREKQIKGGSRAKKIALIETSNPEWKDLYENSCLASQDGLLRLRLAMTRNRPLRRRPAPVHT